MSAARSTDGENAVVSSVSPALHRGGHNALPWEGARICGFSFLKAESPQVPAPLLAPAGRQRPRGSPREGGFPGKVLSLGDVSVT